MKGNSIYSSVRRSNRMRSDTIDFYYFSGTGNTLLVVKKMVEVFTRSNIRVNLFKIEKTDPREIDLDSTIGLAFPVAAQSTYRFIWDFFKALPEAQGTEVFMVDTLYMYSGAIVGPLKRLLNSKGYKTVGAKEIRMPSNLYPTKLDKDKNRKKVAEGLNKAQKYAEVLINGKSRWLRLPLFSDIFYFAVSRNFIWKFIARCGQRFTVDKAKCIKCELCAKLCPVKNIVLEEYPTYQNRCQQCMRCVMFCPTQAIHMAGLKHEIYRAVDAKELL